MWLRVCCFYESLSFNFTLFIPSVKMEIECMEMPAVDVDIKERADDSDDDIYECDFDIAEFVDETLAKLNVKMLTRDAVSNTKYALDVLTLKCQSTDEMYTRLGEQIKKFDTFISKTVISKELFPSLPSKSAASKKTSSPVRAAATYSRSPNQQKKKLNTASGDVIPIAKISVSKPPQLPPAGPLLHKELTPGLRIYAMKGSVFGVWNRAKIVNQKISETGEKLYKVKCDNRRMATQSLSAKHLAYNEPADVLLPVGTRVIAQYRDEYLTLHNSMYAGIVAEPLKQMNRYRYLVFFDDGYAQYVNHQDVRVVCEANKEVWEDVHPDSRDFIRNYLKQYPERPMVKLQVSHVVKTEWNGKWWVAKVVEVDGSLVKMYFHADKRTEWIYRGSTRLGPLYSELASAEATRTLGKLARRHYPALPNKKNAPYVEYTRGLDEPVARSVASYDSLPNDEQDAHMAALLLAQRQNVARKSTTLSPSVPKQPPAVVDVENEGTVETIKIEAQGDRRLFVMHNCSPNCLGEVSDDPEVHRGKSVLTIPMMYGWERQIAKHKSISKRVVFYRTPCGRRLRSLEEIYKYLVLTKSMLTIDLFCMDSYIHVFGEFMPSRVFCYIKDISYGKENVCVSGVNSLDRDYPDYVEYSSKRIPNAGVNLNLDPEFLACCSCEDNCYDRAKCECQQLTVEATGAVPDGQCDPNAGYYFRRLREPLITGVYECNQRCKCDSRCVNRVAQNGLSLRLQVFKTERRGWGMRCLDDIPQGGFICTYAGQLLTEQGANEDGTQFGDEYLAELDYIEVVEGTKEGYESDVMEPESDSEVSAAAASQDNHFDKSKTGPRKKTSPSERKNDEEGEGTKSYSSSASVNDDELCSSDSDFEARTGPVDLRPRSARQKEKVRKLILRREDQESNQSWIVRHKKTGDKSERSSLDETKEDCSTSVSTEDLRSDSVLSETSCEHKEETVKQGGGASPVCSVSSLAITVDSDSESDKSKLRRSTSNCTASSSSKDGNVTESSTSKKQPRSWSKESGSKAKMTEKGLTSEPGKRSKHTSVRFHFGDEFCYIMDAKSVGNIGRFLNHSCGPNAFVQNVFVDTHDLRFPWVAFFALRFIRAGTELTWDYNYEVGSVPNKVLYCYCGSPECRGRLL